MTTPPHTSDHSAAPLPGPEDRPSRVLIIEKNSEARRALSTLLREHGFSCDLAGGGIEALHAAARGDYDVALIGMEEDQSDGLLREMLERAPGVKAIMIGVEPMLDQAVSAMRLGAVDLIARPIDPIEAIASVRHAAQLAQHDRERDDRLRRLERLCHVLGRSRATEAAHVNALCHELETTCDELDAHVQTLRLESEFRAVIEQELDIEALLRATLEHMLRKTGPTNAAVYLPSNHSDFSLGAYVNYDCPKDAADVLLDHLADVLAPAFAHLDDVLVLDDESDLEAHIGDDADWLRDSRVIVFACRDEDECLAVVTFFRDRDMPYADDLVPRLAAMKDVFAQQLAKVVRVHHRMIEDNDWLGADDRDDFGLAA